MVLGKGVDRTKSQKEIVEAATKKAEEDELRRRSRRAGHSSSSITRPNPARLIRDDRIDDRALPTRHRQVTPKLMCDLVNVAYPEQSVFAQAERSTQDRNDDSYGSSNQGGEGHHFTGDNFRVFARERPTPLRRAATRHPNAPHRAIVPRTAATELQPYPLRTTAQTQAQGGLRVAEPHDPRRMQYQRQPQHPHRRNPTSGGDDGCCCCGDRDIDI
ncbi:hypothetical protein JCM5353_003627 [Sporobolomyces roseus]